MNAWAKFLTKFYKDKKKTQKNYMFKDAMKDAQKVYKKQGGASQKSKSNRSRKIRGGAEGEGEESTPAPESTPEPAPESTPEPAPESTPESTPESKSAAVENMAADGTTTGGKSRRNRRGKRGGKARRGGKSQRKAQR